MGRRVWCQGARCTVAGWQGAGWTHLDEVIGAELVVLEEQAEGRALHPGLGEDGLELGAERLEGVVPGERRRHELNPVHVAHLVGTCGVPDECGRTAR